MIALKFKVTIKYVSIYSLSIAEETQTFKKKISQCIKNTY